MSLQHKVLKKNYKTILIATIIALSLIVATVYGKYNPISLKLKEVNDNILKDRKPELFQININLNDFNLLQLDHTELEKLYTAQACYLSKFYSQEDIANNIELEPEKDYDKDGLTNSQEMVLNSNPKEKQTQPGFDDVVLYQDSKSPFNSKLINKQKVHYINKTYLPDDGETLSNILNKKCEEGLSFFELINSERIPVPVLFIHNQDATNRGFNLFFKKNIELIKNKELDIFLNAFNEDQSLAILELESTKQKLEELKTFIVDKEDSKNYLTIHDYYKKIIELYSSPDIESKTNSYKEIMYILNQLQLTL